MTVNNKEERAVVVRRLLAFAVDWFVVILWGGVVFGALMTATGGNPPRPENPWHAQGIGLLTMTIPVILYFAVCESSAMRASLGKRILGLVVSRETGERLSFGSALLRNAVKFAPWEFGHTVAHQAAISGEGGFPTWVWGPATIAFVGPVWWLVAMLATGQTPYDRWALSRVGRSTDHKYRSGSTAENMNSSDPAIEIAGRHLPTIMTQFGCLVARDAEGTPLGSGTGTLVDIDGHRLIITAHHVAEDLAAYPGEMSIIVYPPADGPIDYSNTFLDLPNFRIHPQDRVLLPQGESLDVAAFRAPRDLAAVPHLRWIEASAQLQAVEYLRREYQKDELPFSLFITGFPNFSRATIPSQRTHIFSNFQCWGSLRQFIDTPPILAGNGAPAPQFIFELEMPTEANLPVDAPPLVRVFTRALDAESTGGREPVGGYSGAPVFYLSSVAHYLIGITKEGRNDLGGLMFATTISDIILEIRNAQFLD